MQTVLLFHYLYFNCRIDTRESRRCNSKRYPIAFAGQILWHILQPAQRSSLILTTSPNFSKPGQPNFKQILHCVHFSVMVNGGPNTARSCNGQGASDTISHGIGDSVASLSVATVSLIFRGSTVRMFLKPHALPIP